MERKKLPEKFEITELFLVKAGNDFKRTFIGQIFREITSEGVSIVRGTVVVNEGKIWCSAETQNELENFFDDMCVMKLDMGLHSNVGVTNQIFGEDFFLS